jgi:alanine racemase
MSTNPRSRAWVEIRAAAIRENLRRIRDAAGERAALIPMVKADAYGLGVEDMVRCTRPLDPWGFGVATVAEGEELRALGVEEPVVVFSPAAPGEEESGVAAGLTLSVSTVEGLERLRAAADAADASGGPVRFQLEVDTGMGRAGLPWDRLESWLPQVERLAGGRLEWEGCFTHFHSADVATGEATEAQWRRFRAVLERLRPGQGRRMVHACNSPGALRRAEYAADAVRPGIFAYGGVAGEALPDPVPAVAVRARVLLAREVPVGATVGYGATHSAAGPARWATLGIGYGDGLPRLLSNRGRVLLGGRSCPIVGRISMDVTVVDISDAPQVRPGDVATIIGSDGDECIGLEEVAGLASTINYEVLTGLGGRMPRIWDHG